MNLWTLAVIILVLNLPFGYWRANEKKFSLQWLLAVHLPVPAVIAFRIFTGLGWQFTTFLVLVTAFFFGQLLGGKLRPWLSKHAKVPVTSCLIWDLITKL